MTKGICNSITVLMYHATMQHKDEQKSKHLSSPETLQNVKITWKTGAHLLCATIRRIYRGGRRHHADMSVVVLITLSCRPRVQPGHKDYMKYQYHRYRRRHRHRFCRCVYARPKENRIIGTEHYFVKATYHHMITNKQ